jgi:uncharacterized protein YndB with AHSA1/START domain
MMKATDSMRSLVIERMVLHPPEKVWRALTQVPLLDAWLMKSDFQPIVGHTFDFRHEPSPHWDGVVNCEVLTVVPHEQLAYRWEALGLKSIVTWTLTPIEKGTCLRMEQSGFGPENAYAYDGAQSGWNGMLDTLEGVLAQA